MIATKHKISSIDENSIAADAGIAVGDMLVAINGLPVIDVFDYRTRITEAQLVMSIERADGSHFDVNIDKDEYEDPGIEFENALMDNEKVCHNKCVFCFVDQLPKNLRKTLYFKDDDLRLSFLSGNYVTMTNIDDKELDRLISYKLSPMNISVHTTNPTLRIQMLGNPKAGKIMEQLRRIAASGIQLNTQVVLCPGLNDGTELERTLDDLEQLSDSILSIALVPVGLTGHRGDKKLNFIKPFGRHTAASILEIVVNRQQKYLQTIGRRLLFAADELYIKAGATIPDANEYEDFYQLENGVGTVALFVDEMNSGLNKRIRKRQKKEMNVVKTDESLQQNSPLTKPQKYLLITGMDAKSYISSFTTLLGQAYSASFDVVAITNQFFGETVTVAGLVTGGDIVRSIAPEGHLSGYSIVLIPELMLRHSKDKFLDDMTIEDFEQRIGIPVTCVPPTGHEFLETLDKICR